ncbi:MAG: NAD(P)/FAD-dependent oxidoreductase [Persicimonas sp.]
MSDTTCDVAIIGAGTAGAAAALFCARRGMDAVCVERRPLEEAGAHWINGVPGACFEEAGIALPQAPELLAHGVDFHLVAGFGPERVVVRDHDLMEVDMRLLVQRLQQAAREAGARLQGSTRVDAIDYDGLQTSGGTIRARWYIDASGLAGADLLGAPRPAPSDICTAAQAVHHVEDRNQAGAFFEEHGVQPGQTLCFSGIEGGYSILNLRLDDDHMSILTGSIPAEGYRSGRAILRDFVEDTPWVGEQLFGGARAIPLGQPHRRLQRGNVAALGDAAGQVFSAHGSGIGAGLIAARILADALADGRDLAGYERAWNQRFRSLYTSADVFRRFSQSLDIRDLQRLMRSGLMDAELAKSALEQRMPKLAGTRALSKLAALAGSPRFAIRLAPLSAKSALAALRSDRR